MSEAHVDQDVAGTVKWFAGYGPVPVVGECPHRSCGHTVVPTIAWGPDYEHYCLVRCDDPAGCAGQCRGWAAEYPWGEGPQLKLHGFKMVWGNSGADPCRDLSAGVGIESPRHTS